MTKLILAFRNSANAHTKGMDTATDGLHLPAAAAPYFCLLYDNKLTGPDKDLMLLLALC